MQMVDPAAAGDLSVSPVLQEPIPQPHLEQYSNSPSRHDKNETAVPSPEQQQEELLADDDASGGNAGSEATTGSPGGSWWSSLLQNKTIMNVLKLVAMLLFGFICFELFWSII